MSTMPMPDVEEVDEPVQMTLTDEDRAGIASLVRGVLNEERTARRSEVRIAWRQRAFRNGIQHIWYDSNSYTYLTPEASGLEVPRYMAVYNIYTPHWRSFVSLLSQNPPGINFVPNDLQKALDVTAASYGEKMRHRVDRLLNMKDRQGEIAGYFCTDGRTITRVYTDAKGVLRATIHGVLESKVPIFARKMERWAYCVLSEEIDKYEAKEEWPDFADEIDSGDSAGSDSQYERLARLNVIANKKGGGGDFFKSLVTQHIAWVRPSRYRKASDDLKAKLKEMFPSGLRATMISDVVVDAVEETMESALACQWPSPGQGQNRPSMLHDLVPIQEDFNDILNMIREHGDYSIPARWVSDVVDSESIAEQISAPGVTHQITVPTGGRISDLVFVEPTPSLPAELVANADRLMQLADFTTGDLPSLQGAGDSHSETASGQKMLSDQAKGQLSNAWGAMQWMFADIYSIAVPLAAKMAEGQETIAVQGNSGQESFNPSAILDGQFGCYPNTDSSFPETMADKRAALQMVLTQIGTAGDVGLSVVTSPDNLKLISQYSGLTDLIIPGAEARDKQLEEIEQLLTETPIPDQTKMPQWEQAAQQAMLQGQPPPPMPLLASVGVKPRDYHVDEVTKCNEWLSSPACREELRKGNSLGVQNVELHADLHDQAIAAKAAANAPPPQFKPPNVSLTGQISDPVAIAAILKADGIATTPENVQASQLPDTQNVVAKTQHSAAQAMHQSVLAAKEAVAPVKSIPSPQAPDQPTRES